MPNPSLYGDADSDFVEVDPTGRYGRYNEVLGRGASKTVYRAFDEIEGIEVAWNQVKLSNVLKSPEDLQRLCSEVHLLKTLKHKNIIKFYASWIDTKAGNINFVTEMFTSGSLRQYRQRHKRVDIRAVKNWARQILRGLLYLHSHDPPIIHRDLKCDNVFVNGNQGEVKIGDLGLAAILRKTQSAHTVIGTPEFMAPELYEEEYNELVDIYAFGMCMLEMLTFDYPYSECSNTVQIYKKVMEGKKPAALYKVKDPEVRQFVEKCLATVSRRLPARDLLMDPFLKEQGSEDQYYYLPKPTDLGDFSHFLREPQLQFTDTNLPPIEEAPNKFNGIIGLYDASINHTAAPLPSSHPQSQEDNTQFSLNMDLTLKGKRRDAHTINLRLRILDNEGRIRNIYFPFDVKEDTAMSVASEMVAELGLTDQNVTKIADMIDEEIIDHFPNWKEDYEKCYSSTNAKERGTTTTSTNSSENSLLEFVRTHCCVEKMACTRMECASMHGRFEEVTFHVEGGAEYSSFLAGDAPPLSNGSFDAHLRHHEHDWGNNQSSPTSSSSHSHVSNCNANNNNDASLLTKHHQHFAEEDTRHCSSPSSNADFNDSSLSDEEDDAITRNLRLLAIRHQRELRELQFRHEHALLEIEQHLQRRKARRSSNTKCSGCYNPREMGVDSPKKVGCPSMTLSTKVRMEYQESSSRNSPRSVLYGGRSPVSSSPNENQKLMKMHSFNDVDSQLYDRNSMPKEVCKLKRAQTIATYRTDRMREIKRSNASHRIRSISSSSKNLPPKSYTSTNKIQSK